MNKIFIFTVIIIIFTLNAFAEVYNGSFFFKNINNIYVIFVDKSEKTLHVYEVIDDLPVEKLHFNNILLGEIKGNKEIEGDKKTPEGVYFIKTFISGDKLAPIYGLGAFPLNYPNFFDKKNGKTGHGIWIHGVNDKEKKDFTQGCIAIQNNQIKALKNLGIISSTVIIAPNINFLSIDAYNAEKINWLNYLNEYINSWQNNDYESFSNLIHPDFINNKGQNKDVYLKQKKQLMKLYDYKKIKVLSTEIYKENDIQNIIKYKQNYCAPNMLVTGIKTLYLQKEPNGWKIIGEDFKNLPLDFDIKETAQIFVKNWKASWENKDINKYISFYSKNFKTKKMNLISWKKYKTDKFNKAKEINIKISELHINKLTPIKYKVTFIQKYQADSYSDIGYKTLTLEGCPGDYKIISETWRPLK